jgi:hypothetical protein
MTAAHKQQTLVFYVEIQPILHNARNINFCIALAVVVIKDYPSACVDCGFAELAAIYAEIIKEREQIISVFLALGIFVPAPERGSFVKNQLCAVYLPWLQKGGQIKKQIYLIVSAQMQWVFGPFQMTAIQRAVY